MQTPNVFWEDTYNTSFKLGRNISDDEFIYDEDFSYISEELQKKLLELIKGKFNIFNMSNKKDNNNNLYLKLMKDDV